MIYLSTKSSSTQATPEIIQINLLEQLSLLSLQLFRKVIQTSSQE